MTVRIADHKGNEWTVEGDWRAAQIGTDFDGRGAALIRLWPDSEDAHLEPVVVERPPLSLPGRRNPELPSPAAEVTEA